MGDPKKALDFARIKQAVRLEHVFEREGLLTHLKRHGSVYTGPCPLHGGTNKKQFRLDTEKQLFRCFSPRCGLSGDVLTIVSLTHHVTPLQAAALLSEWYARPAASPQSSRRTPMATEEKGRAPDYRAFTVKGEGDDAWWTRIGSAWANKAGGLNIQLDALPLDGKIVLMPPKEDEEPPKKPGKR